jgi:tRNA threonylcarbamoyladenosine biosynthesis protein TsaB
VSLALGSEVGILAETSFVGGARSPSLLARIDELLGSIGAGIRDVDSIIAARGPGSFTGLRSGLATVLGLRQALGIRATAVPSFQPLADQAPADGTVVAAIDALRGEWFVQFFEPGRSPTPSTPQIVPAAALRSSGSRTVVAFGSEALRREIGEEEGVTILEAAPLAPCLVRIAATTEIRWDPAALVSPLYLRPPAARSGL